MIKSFKDFETQQIWEGYRSKKLPMQIQDVARRKLRMMNNSTTLNELSIPPANRLEQLKGDRKGQWIIRINERWRICFVWRDNDAYNVEIVDYH